MQLKKYFLLISCIILGSSLAISNNVNDGFLSAESNNIKKLGGGLESQYLSDEDIDLGTPDENVIVTIPGLYTTDTSLYVPVNFSIETSGKYYCIGYGTSGDDDIDAKIYYHVQPADGGPIETREANVSQVSVNGYYDRLSNLARVYSQAIIELDAGDKFVNDTIYVTNLFEANDNNGVLTPIRDENNNLIPKYVAVDVSGIKTYELDELVSFEYEGYSEFGSYSTISINATSFGAEAYQDLGVTYLNQYNNYQYEIEDGIYVLRTRVGFTSNTRFYFYYEGQSEPQVIVPYTQTIDITDSKTLRFLFEEVEAKDVIDFHISNYTVTLDIYYPDSGRPLGGTTFTARFGNTRLGYQDVVDANGNVLISKTNNPYSVNLNLIMGISIGIYVLCYIGLSIYLYFYLKNKNKDNEFKRMRSNSYWKNNILGLVCSSSIALFIESIIFRSTLFNGTFTVFNLVDIFIIVFGLISILIGAYFIKYFYKMYKNYLQAKQVDKLKLNRNRYDDGTIDIDLTTKE